VQIDQRGAGWRHVLRLLHFRLLISGQSSSSPWGDASTIQPAMVH